MKSLIILCALLFFGCDSSLLSKWSVACLDKSADTTTFTHDLPPTGEPPCEGESDFIARLSTGGGIVYRYRQTESCCQRATCWYSKGDDPIEECGGTVDWGSR